MLKRGDHKSADGKSADGALVQAAGGTLYGAAGLGGAGPAALTLGTDGLLYGVALYERTDGGGVVFRLGQDGKDFQVLHAFRGVAHDTDTNEDGAQPMAAPVFGRDGALYGTTTNGDRIGCGVLYRLPTDGARFAVLHHFQRRSLGSKGGGPRPAASCRKGP